MTLEYLDGLKRELKARGIDVDALQASDLYSDALDGETKNVLSLDLARRHSANQAAAFETAEQSAASLIEKGVDLTDPKADDLFRSDLTRDEKQVLRAAIGRAWAEKERQLARVDQAVEGAS